MKKQGYGIRTCAKCGTKFHGAARAKYCVKHKGQASLNQLERSLNNYRKHAEQINKRRRESRISKNDK